MTPEDRSAAAAARGFMPTDEGLALNAAAVEALAAVESAPMLEVGSYCGKSALYLGAAARDAGRVLYALDHHRGSEENQAGWEHHDADLVDPELGLLDTLPTFRRTVNAAGLDRVVVALVGHSEVVAPAGDAAGAPVHRRRARLEPAHRDYELWTPKVAPGGTLAIHDVFPDPADGGRPPYEIYLRALESERFVETGCTGSLRILRRV
ncbi:MAG: class I SAM-dependent methyltransferase [Microthrixaceae bacterium]